MEVGKMPAQRKTNQSRGLTAAGLIAVTAATLLMMAWAIFPTAALADGTHVWGVDDNKQGSTKLPCANGGHWIFQFTGTVTTATLHVAGEPPITMALQGGHFVADSSGPVDANTSVSVTWTGSGDGDFLTLSHCVGVTPTPGSITVVKQTIPDGSAQQFEFDTDYGSNFSLTDGQQNNSGDLAAGTYSVAEVNIPTGWSLTNATCSDGSNPNAINLAEGEDVTCTFTNTQSATTTTPGGGGGGGTTTTPPPAPTTTTTTPPIVAPTTIHNTSTTPAAKVLPTTVRPGKLAFTGIEDVVPIGALALTLMTTGSGLLWAGSRRRRHDGSEDED
jgi:hypothetical protein